MRVNFMKLRLLIREYYYYNGVFPFANEIFKIYKEREKYPHSWVNFSKELSLFRKQNLPINFIEDEQEYQWRNEKRIRKAKRVIVR